MTHRVLIFASGTLKKDYLREIKSGDFIIGVDGAALWLIQNKVHPDLAIGDFDTVSSAQYQIIRTNSLQIKKFTPHKDYTDLELAVKHTLLLNPKEVIIFGATGTRLDHTLGNIALLEKFLKLNIPTRIIDAHNIIILAEKSLQIKKSLRYPYFSILPYTRKVIVTISGVKYNIENKEIQQGETIGISNEIVGKYCRIEVHSGIVIVIRSRD